MSEGYKKTILANGLRVVSEEMDNVRSVSVGIWVTTGSRHDPPAKAGLSHLLEHMLFKGTENRTTYEIATSLEALGGQLNAFTEKEFTCYYALILNEHLGQAVDVMADVIQNALLNPQDLKNEKHIVFEEIRNVEDSPEDRIHDLFVETVFTDDPLGMPILGSSDSVKRIRNSDLTTHLNAHYHSGNMIAAAAGNLDHDRFVQLIDRHFGNLPAGDIIESPIGRASAGHKSRIQAPISQSHICSGSVGFSYNDPRKYSLIVLNTLLGGGMSSRLFQLLREQKGLAYSVYTFLDFWRDTGLFGVYAGTAPKKGNRVQALIDRELRKLCEESIAESDLNRIQSQLIGGLLLGLEDSTGRMNRLAKLEAFTNGFTPVQAVQQQIEAVTPSQVMETAKTLFQSQDRYTTRLQPE